MQILRLQGKVNRVLELLRLLAKYCGTLTLGEIKERMDTIRAQEVYFRTNQQN